MGNRLFSALILITLSVPGLAVAQQPSAEPRTAGGLYFAGQFSLGIANKTESEGIYTASLDYTGSHSGHMGYRAGPVRLEGQIGYEIFGVNSIIPVAGSPMTAIETDVNFSGLGIMGNLFYDFGAPDNVRPYLGIGMGSVNIGVVEQDSNCDSCAPTPPQLIGADTVLAGQAMAGVTIPAGWSSGEWYVGYRYFRTGDMEFDLVGYGPITQDGIESHSVMFGLRYFLR